MAEPATGRVLSRGRQLSLFKGKRQRGVSMPPPKEFALHCAVADTVRRWILPGWIWTHFPAGEARSAITGARLKRMGLARGFPDFQFFHDSGTCAFLELKRRGQSLDENQEAIAEHLKAAGHRYRMADSYDAAITALVGWGILRSMKVQ